MPPISDMKRAPAAKDAMDIAGIGEKPATRSGPYVLMVLTCAAATNSATSSQSARTRPPLPRARLYARAFAGSRVISAQAATGSPSRPRASRHSFSRAPRTYG
ncbi:hypothetical protein SMF913_25846 [Streptomyces malaysiensis]|uniref:Uncharacterized protein n=1 Tax=Streptomyces malaysiensis TaxID=92644 RepID=A0A2J7YQT1_STRMQ|nr:hypothetical protein SMF913_25846 [Streptomyces malaysiensis]